MARCLGKQTSYRPHGPVISPEQPATHAATGAAAASGAPPSTEGLPRKTSQPQGCGERDGRCSLLRMLPRTGAESVPSELASLSQYSLFSRAFQACQDQTQLWLHLTLRHTIHILGPRSDHADKDKSVKSNC